MKEANYKDLIPDEVQGYASQWIPSFGGKDKEDDEAFEDDDEDIDVSKSNQRRRGRREEM